MTDIDEQIKQLTLSKLQYEVQLLQFELYEKEQLAKAYAAAVVPTEPKE